MGNDKKSGFTFIDPLTGIMRVCYFMEGHEKDISFPRWRLTLYYASHLAATIFFDSKEKYDEYISAHQEDVYSDFDLFKMLEA